MGVGTQESICHSPTGVGAIGLCTKRSWPHIVSHPPLCASTIGIYCHNIPTHTPQSGYHGVTEVAKTAKIPKMAEKCINCMSARPTPPHTNPIESLSIFFCSLDMPPKKSRKSPELKKLMGGSCYMCEKKGCQMWLAYIAM